jgi:two-component system, sensor histidine kinase and response regulator
MDNQYILIVDDSLENLRVVGSFLKERKYKTALAKSAQEALDVIENSLPILILLDVMMPEMDGYEFCSILKNDQRFKDIPVIFLTAKNETSDIIDGFKAGGADYIAKPFNSEELYARVSYHIELQNSKLTIQKLNEELKEANHTKDQIFSIISHDIRTPVATLRMLLSTILPKDFSKDQVYIKESLKLMEASAGETYQLLDNLLYWSRSQLNAISVSPVFFNASEIIHNILSLLKHNANVKKITFECDIPDEILIFADEEMINTVFRNLISNAIKFSYQGGIIRVKIQKLTDHTQFLIEDNGRGIPSEQLEYLFQDNKYYTTVGTIGEKGSGLGLKICKKFVELNHGNIWASSELGNGSHFYISLPNHSYNL